MATTLQIVADDLTTVLFDLNDETGVNNAHAGGVKTMVAVGGGIGLGSAPLETIDVSPAAFDGGRVVSTREPLHTSSWRQRIYGVTDVDDLEAGVGELGRLLAQGGILKRVLHGSSETRYIDFEPSPTPALLSGRALELYQVSRLFDTPEGIELAILRHPGTRGTELNPALNLAANPTLTHDFGGTANRPDGWGWDGTIGLSAESIVQVERGVRRGAYQFTIADGTVHNLSQETGAATASAGQVWTGSFYARVTAGVAKMRPTIKFRSAAHAVLAYNGASLGTLTTSWQRLNYTAPAAPANTDHAELLLEVDNDDATSVTIQVCNAQLEIASTPSPFRVPAAAVAYNPTSTSLPRKLAIWGEGNRPSLGKFKVTADALQLGRYRVYRVSERAIDILKATLHKSLRSGTLGTDTTSVVDSDGADGNVAQVAYSEPAPTFGTDAVTSGTGTTITVVKPASLALGEAMVAYVLYFRANAQIVAPPGWQLLGLVRLTAAQVGTGQEHILYVWYKTADADDVAATDFTFDVVHATGGALTAAYRSWIGRFTNIDPENPIDAFKFNSETSISSAPTLLSVTPSADNAMIVGIVAGCDDGQTGSPSFTAPAGTTPTYTEQDDGQASETFRGAAVYTGVLATAAATGDKDAAASVTGFWTTCHIALRKSPASTIVRRSTVTFTGLPPGDYDVWLSMRPTAICRDRIRIGWALKASPTDGELTYLPDYILDTLGASTFTEYVDRLFGRLHVPEDHPLDTLTVAVFSAREQTSAANLRLDIVALGPAFEHVATLVSPTLLANGEHLASDGETGAVFHLDTSSELSQPASVDGPAPLEVVPGFQVLCGFPVKEPLTGFADPTREITAAPTLGVTHTPRYR